MPKFEVHKPESRRTDSRESTGARNHRLIIPSRNLLIAALPQFEVNELIAAAYGVHLKSREIVYEGGDEIEYAYFPIDCVISSLALLEDGSTVEIAMTGREGLVGIPALVGGGRALHWTRVSVTGAALRISKAALEEQASQSEALHRVVLRSYRGLFNQICQRSVCNVRHSLLQRLCVWLLMMHDRVGHDELPLTQEEIASYISVRRAGVSVASQMLQSMHGVASRRGKIVILDRDTIEHAACECYEAMRKQFEPFDPTKGGGGNRSIAGEPLQAR